MRDDSTEIFQSLLLEALVSSSGIGRDVHSLIFFSSNVLPYFAVLPSLETQQSMVNDYSEQNKNSNKKKSH